MYSCIIISKVIRSTVFFPCKRIAEENEKESLVETNILGFDLSLSQAMERNWNKKRKKQIHQTPTQKYLVEKPSAFLDQVMQCTQVNSLTKSKIDSFISQNRDDYNDDLCASGARFCNELLGLSNAASGDGVSKGTLRQMLIDIKNTATRSHLETGSESLPGFSSTFHFSDLTDDHIILFLLKHNDASLQNHHDGLDQNHRQAPQPVVNVDVYVSEDLSMNENT